jgi:maltooligosyltrehalose trehalohydrolase
MHWQPSFGAWREGQGTRFRVWAPVAETVEVVLVASDERAAVHPLARSADGCFAALLPSVGPGDLYKYRLNGQNSFPDPASRFQPAGVHGPSQVVAPSDYRWNDVDWRGIAYEDLILYELHVGTFTPGATFQGILDKLPYLKELGINAVELMPVADFPGERNWGYDGVDLYAPARCYGKPDELCQLVDQAHQLGLAVLLDVVYNHLGPDGNYLGCYSPYYFSTRHHSPWGQALNFDGEHSCMVRAFFIDNALHWLHEYHLDGLRLDATHAIVDDSAHHFLAELSERVRSTITDRAVYLIAEDHRNLAKMVQPFGQGGWGLDGVWADDFHHQMRRLLAGDHEGYYADFAGSTPDLAATIQQGWFFCGQHSEHLEQPRGTDPTDLSPRAFVFCLQNHDQVGNRAFGTRLNQQIEHAAYRAATALLLCAPETPLLFMGQEWAATAPFRYFTDHHEELGRLVTAGRRQEFRHFSDFRDPILREQIPDPQASATFDASRLNWQELQQPLPAATLRLYRTLLQLRRSEPALRSARHQDYDCFAPTDAAVVLVRRTKDGPALLLVCQLRGTGTVDLSEHSLAAAGWQVVLTTEDADFAPETQPPHMDLGSIGPVLHFQRPGAALLRADRNI